MQDVKYALVKIVPQSALTSIHSYLSRSLYGSGEVGVSLLRCLALELLRGSSRFSLCGDGQKWTRALPR